MIIMKEKLPLPPGLQIENHLPLSSDWILKYICVRYIDIKLPIFLIFQPAIGDDDVCYFQFPSTKVSFLISQQQIKINLVVPWQCCPLP